MAVHRESRASDVLEATLFSRPPDSSPAFTHCNGTECVEERAVGDLPHGTCTCECGLCRAMNAELEARARNAAAVEKRPPAPAKRETPKRQGTTQASSYGGFDPRHCNRPDCTDVRTRVHAGGPQWCCACSCGGCKSATQAYLKAATMEHCGNKERCLPRLRAGSQHTFPACGCGCDACHAIAVASGVRPANHVPSLTDADVARILAERGTPRAQGANEAPASPAPRPPPAPSPEEVAAEGPELGDDPVLEEELGDDPVLEEELGDDPVLEEELGDDPPLEEELGDDPEPEANVVSPAAAAAAASPTHRLRVLVEAHTEERAPVVTGSKCSLLRECLYWTREDVERAADETSDDAAYGTIGHLFAEEYARGRVTMAREEELIELAPPDKRDLLRTSIGHVRKWIDDHRDKVRAAGPLMRAELPVAWDPDPDSGEPTGRGVELATELEEMFVSGAGARAYADGRVWSALRQRLELGPRSIPATIDLVRFEDGQVVIYDWCFGRTDKRRQLALGALAIAGVHRVTSVLGRALYVDEDGVREWQYAFTGDDLVAVAAEFRALLTQAPSSEPRAGTHCVHDYCPARFSCPITLTAVETALDPEAPGEMVEVVTVDERGDERVTTVERSMSHEVNDRAYAEWFYPRLLLVKAFAARAEKELREWIAKQSEPLLKTSPGKCLAEVSAKGRVSFNQKYAVALLQTKGAKESEIRDCFRQGPSSARWVEKNLPKSP